MIIDMMTLNIHLHATNTINKWIVVWNFVFVSGYVQIPKKEYSFFVSPKILLLAIRFCRFSSFVARYLHYPGTDFYLFVFLIFFAVVYQYGIQKKRRRKSLIPIISIINIFHQTKHNGSIWVREKIYLMNE